MKQLFLCHLITFLCFLVCSQTQLHLCFICHLFWDNQMSENRRRLFERSVLRFTFYVLRFTFYVLRSFVRQ
jgi:hypothetical protein